MKKEYSLLLGVLGVAAGVLGYFYGYQKLVDKAETLEAQNVVDEQEIARLQALEENREQYLADSKTYNTEIAKIVNEFPSYFLPEDDIKYAYTHSSEIPATMMLFNTMSFTSPAEVYATQAYSSTEGSQLVEAINVPAYTLYKAQTSYSIQCTYDSLKRMVTDMYSAEGHKTIDDVTVVFDTSTGLLTGTMVSGTYFVYGQDKPYSQPSLTPVQFGTDNIFGTIVPEETAVETEAAETAAE